MSSMLSSPLVSKISAIYSFFEYSENAHYKVFSGSTNFCFSDVQVIFNFIMAYPSMQQGETWTPICVPGCTEEYMLHVYICFKQVNLGMVLVCTDHQSFEDCHEFNNSVLEELSRKKFYAGANKPCLQDVVNRCTF